MNLDKPLGSPYKWTIFCCQSWTLDLWIVCFICLVVHGRDSYFCFNYCSNEGHIMYRISATKSISKVWVKCSCTLLAILCSHQFLFLPYSKCLLFIETLHCSYSQTGIWMQISSHLFIWWYIQGIFRKKEMFPFFFISRIGYVLMVLFSGRHG